MIQMQTMEASVSNELLEGEELIWSGRPLPKGKSIASPARLFSVVGLVYGGLGLGLMLVLFLSVSLNEGIDAAWPALI
ncbi:MAG TPA: hypothetical protein VHD63_00050, partial [Ktedonobacteraceae bacterium]|nr:hypothetical protein [Ktedonobacteraceae bacterium]